MRIAVISDIHANRQALEAVLRVVWGRGADMTVCCGDVVGYGGDPEACVDLVRSTCALTVVGNHDLAVATEKGIDDLPPEGREAARVHRELLNDWDLAWLGALPDRADLDDVTFVHATPDAPREWRRPTWMAQNLDQFRHFTGSVCFHGHTHQPSVVANRIGVFSVRRGVRYLIDVGSVGQPRDRDPRAAFGLFDAGSFHFELVRVEYDGRAAARRLQERRLPDVLAHHILLGI